MSQIAPVVSLDLFYDNRSMFLQSPSVVPSARKVEPKKSNVFVDGISSSLTFTV